MQEQWTIHLIVLVFRVLYVIDIIGNYQQFIGNYSGLHGFETHGDGGVPQLFV